MNKRWSIIIIVFILLSIIGSLMMFRSMKEQENLVNRIKKTHFVIDDKNYEGDDFFKVKDGKTYIKVETLKDHIYDKFRMSISGLRVLTAINDKKIDLEDSYLTNFVKSAEIDLNFPIKKIDEINYIDIKKLSSILGFSYSYAPITNALLIDTTEYEMIYGTASGKKLVIFETDDIKSFKLKELDNGEQVKIFKEKGDWLKVRSEEGLIGYIQKDKIFNYKKEEDPNNLLMKSREDFHKYKKINVTWDYISTYDQTPDLSAEEKIKGLDVISPTWFNLTQNGLVINNGDIKYVEDAHEKGYEVWALFKNNFDPDLTTEMLNDSLLREKVIAQIVFYSAYYGLDGINIDFENVYLKDKQPLVTFIKELDFYLEKQNIVLSIDVTVPWGSDMWSNFLDRKAISKYVDYVMLMAYDEHWASSPKSGSVASIGWVERGISESLKLIPKEKLVLGVPFYTRVWTETETDGKIKVKSKSIGMQYIDSFLADKNESLTWDENAGQFLAEYKIDDGVQKIWIEDETSIELKVELVNKYDIAGVASWRKGFENKEIWEKIYETIKE